MLQAATQPIFARDDGSKRNQRGGMSNSRDDDAPAPDGSAGDNDNSHKGVDDESDKRPDGDAEDEEIDGEQEEEVDSQLG